MRNIVGNHVAPGRRWPGRVGLSCYGLSPSGAKTHETE
ncbi:DUF2213 domain-containing protein [Escherichia coli]|nr:DUF2213 domain-containing protein [Escherichia coli]UJY52283.1 DUF2213 domain-containing protein [Escherichia coli]